METPLYLLIVDDNEDDIVLAREALASARRFTVVHVARNGVEAMAYLRQEPPHENGRRPDLVLLDINMPQLNGFETLQAIKADPALRALPVIMLTTSDREDDITRAYDYGSSTYVRKPLDFADFVEAMMRLEAYWGRTALLPGK